MQNNWNIPVQGHVPNIDDHICCKLSNAHSLPSSIGLNNSILDSVSGFFASKPIT